ncbi:hypothetical protein ANN_27172 [Periplaneta americana]|uniref:Uncharacterized protein n=1 Tax=Periplaneta americana TaxID=6978 RepID=A0ABQ8RXA0_PERAM|nr:hypothetical protein ANN_27172 [Periplaneta americana]
MSMREIRHPVAGSYSVSSGSTGNYSFVYNVKLEGTNVTVCKGFLLKVLQITETRMKTRQQALKVGAVATTENRGKHTNRPRKIVLQLD